MKIVKRQIIITNEVQELAFPPNTTVVQLQKTNDNEFFIFGIATTDQGLVNRKFVTIRPEESFHSSYSYIGTCYDGNNEPFSAIEILS